MSTTQIKLLDCTLRDGGYVNNWRFGLENIDKIISSLISSNIDYVEAGYLKDEVFFEDYSLFSIQDSFLKFSENASRISFMLDFEKINLDKLFQNIAKFKNFTLRIAFKRPNLKKALEFSEKLIDFGCNISLNPMHSASYTEEELEYLFNVANRILPSSLVIVDTNGQMHEEDTIRFAKFFDSNLNSKIALGFHSHNNLDLSFSNAKIFIENIKEREIIIDSSLYGIGRGAGNLKTEDIATFLNDKYSKKYNIDILNNSIESLIMPIYKKNPWMLTKLHMIVARNKCHPNYATFLLKNNLNDINFCEYAIKNISKNYKDVYNEELISEFCKCGV